MTVLVLTEQFEEDAVQGNARYRDRGPWVAFWLICALGTSFLILNIDLPVARNALVYAKASLGIVENHFNVLAVVRDFALTSGKPILFPLLASPFTGLFDANTGVVLASGAGTFFYLWSVVLVLRRLNRALGIEPRWIQLEFILVVLNPLVLYQFWSAYPDSLFAGLVLLAFVLTDVMVTEPDGSTRRHIVALGLVVALAIHAKLYGAVLGLACPVYIWMHRSSLLANSRQLAGKVLVFCLVFAALGVMLLLARAGIYPFLEITAGGGFDAYAVGVSGEAGKLIADSLRFIGFALVFLFHMALLLLLGRKAWRAWSAAALVFTALYILGLLVFPGTPGNMRYLLPVLPFIAPALAMGAASLGRAARRAILAGYVVVAAALTLTFNVAAVQQLAEPLMARVVSNAQYNYQLGWLDNLRLLAQLELKRQIDTVNATVPDRSLVYWASNYYYEATHGLAEHLGMKAGLDIRYVAFASQIPPSSQGVFAYLFAAYPLTHRLPEAPAWAMVKQSDRALFRLEPFFVRCKPVTRSLADGGLPTEIYAEATVGPLLNIQEVDFTSEHRILGSGRAPQFHLNWLDPSSGRHEIVATGRSGSGEMVSSAPIVCYTGMDAFERTVRSTVDMAVEPPGRDAAFPYKRLMMSKQTGWVAIRFTDIDVSRGSQPSSVYLEFAAAEVDADPATLEVRAEQSGVAMAFEPQRMNITRRARTRTAIAWKPAPWLVVGERHRTPDLAPLLAQVFRSADWKDGNAIVFTIHVENGRRVAQVPGDSAQCPPRLYVELRRPSDISVTGSMSSAGIVATP